MVGQELPHSFGGDALDQAVGETNWRLMSAQSHCDSERPAVSGRWQASFTACIATAGGKDRRAAGARAILQAVQTLF
jgi:hypothetical protein